MAILFLIVAITIFEKDDWMSEFKHGFLVGFNKSKSVAVETKENIATSKYNIVSRENSHAKKKTEILIENSISRIEETTLQISKGRDTDLNNNINHYKQINIPGLSDVHRKHKQA